MNWVDYQTESNQIISRLSSVGIAGLRVFLGSTFVWPQDVI